MAQTQPVMLPVPRVVTGIKRRVRVPEPERLCVLDDVPLLVRAPTDAEAPVCVRYSFTRYRGFEGALYRPLFAEWVGDHPPGVASAVIRARANNETGGEQANHPWRDKGERLVDVRKTFAKARRDRGLRTVEAHQFREIHDEGLAAQRLLADRMAANLILVDGGLWHRCPSPEYGVGVRGRLCDPDADTCTIDAHCSGAYLADVVLDRFSREPDPEPTDGPWMTFAPTEADKLAAFAEALGAEPWHGRGKVRLDDLRHIEVLDRDAYERAAPVRTPSAVLAESAAYFLRVTARHLPDLPDAGIHAYVAAREAVAGLGTGLDPDEAYARIRPYAEAIDAMCEDAVRTRGMGDDDDPMAYGAMSDLTHAARALRLRYERFESPRPELYAADSPEVEALSSLAR